MSVKHGIKGVVKVGANIVAEVQSWSYQEEDPAPLQQLSMGDTSETPVASGAKRGSGSIECLLDITDTNGQKALTTGASVTLALQTGSVTGEQINSGSVVIRSRSKGSQKGDFVTFNASFEGVLTESSVT